VWIVPPSLAQHSLGPAKLGADERCTAREPGIEACRVRDAAGREPAARPSSDDRAWPGPRLLAVAAAGCGLFGPRALGPLAWPFEFTRPLSPVGIFSGAAAGAGTAASTGAASSAARSWRRPSASWSLGAAAFGSPKAAI